MRLPHISLRILGALTSLLPAAASGQQAGTLFLMHDVPQSSFLNPAVQLRCKYFAGLPGVGSVHFAYDNTAFTYNDLAGSETWNLYGVYDQLHRVDLARMEAHLHPVALGYRRKSMYVTFHVAEKIHAIQTVPRDLAQIALQGNGPFVGETAVFDALRTSFTHLREYALGASRVLNERWVAGIRAKLLFGKAGLRTGRSRTGFTTGENSFDLALEGDYLIQSAFPVQIHTDADGRPNSIELEETDLFNYLLNRANPGAALDMGVIHRYSEQLTLSASLLDVGFIRWRREINNVNAAGTFRFTGIEPSTEIVSFRFLADMRDSVVNSFETSVTREPFTSVLPPRLMLGRSYRVREQISLGAVSRHMVSRSKIHSSLTFSATVNMADRILAAVSWSYMNNSVRNIGAGLAYTGKGFQLHLASDNLLGLFYPFDTRSAGLRAGFNLMLGCPRNKKEELEGESYGKGPAVKNCHWRDWKRNRQRKMRRTARELSDI